MDKKTTQEFKEKLEKEKKALEKELKTFAVEDTAPQGDWDTKYPKYDSGNMEEEADEFQEYDKMLSVEHSLEIRLKNVNLALEKIKEGKYSICEKCGKEIDIKRLTACPEARFCIKCKEVKPPRNS